MIDACVAELEPLIGTGPACRAAGKSKATHYRRHQPPKLGPPPPRGAPANALYRPRAEPRGTESGGRQDGRWPGRTDAALHQWEVRCVRCDMTTVNGPNEDTHSKA